jgi:hypothetical protein
MPTLSIRLIATDPIYGGELSSAAAPEIDLGGRWPARLEPMSAGQRLRAVIAGE